MSTINVRRQSNVMAKRACRGWAGAGSDEKRKERPFVELLSPFGAGAICKFSYKLSNELFLSTAKTRIWLPKRLLNRPKILCFRFKGAKHGELRAKMLSHASFFREPITDVGFQVAAMGRRLGFQPGNDQGVSPMT